MFRQSIIVGTVRSKFRWPTYLPVEEKKSLRNLALTLPCCIDSNTLIGLRPFAVSVCYNEQSRSEVSFHRRCC